MTAANYPNRLANQPAPKTGNSFEMEERKDPTFVQFGDGETLTGVLVNIERIEVSKKQVSRFTLADVETSELSSFLGTYQLDSKIRRSDLGHVLEVRCEGKDPKVTKNGNAMKLFRVRVSNRKVQEVQALEDGTYITDDDLPVNL